MKEKSSKIYFYIAGMWRVGFATINSIPKALNIISVQRRKEAINKVRVNIIIHPNLFDLKIGL